MYPPPDLTEQIGGIADDFPDWTNQQIADECNTTRVQNGWYDEWPYVSTHVVACRLAMYRKAKAR